MGLLVKQNGRTTLQNRSVNAFAAHFVPLVWVLSSEEFAYADCLGLGCSREYAQTHFNVDVAPRVKQLHADLAGIYE